MGKPQVFNLNGLALASQLNCHEAKCTLVARTSLGDGRSEIDDRVLNGRLERDFYVVKTCYGS